jgi:hypothetical protein
MEDVDDVHVLLFEMGLVLLLLAWAPSIATDLARLVTILLAALSTFVAVWRSRQLFQQSVMACREEEAEHPSTRFSSVMAVYAINVLALALVYTFAAAVDPSSISHTDPTSLTISVFFESVYDMTLVASGTGFGQRVPLTWLPKVVAFVCSAYLTIYMSMTVFTRILSSSLMYVGGHSRDPR